MASAQSAASIQTTTIGETDEQKAAAAKIQALGRGKKAKFQLDEKKEAAKKIQAIKRGKDVRRHNSAGKLMPPKPMNRQLSRRVSFGGSSSFGGPTFLETLTAAIRKCAADNNLDVPCLDGSSSVATVSNATGADVRDAAAAAVARKEEADAAEAAAPELSPELLAKVTELFKRIDDDGNGTITKDEAEKFWGKNWAKVNAQAMFNEVDDDASGTVSQEKWMMFWRNVISSGYPEEDVLEEVDMIMGGGTWVDFDDGRTT